MKSKTAFADLYTYIWAALTVVSRVAFNFFGMYSFAPVGPVSMFGGARVSLLKAILIALGMMVVSDVLLSLIFQNADYFIFHVSRPVVYTSYVITVVIGYTLVGQSRSPIRIGTAALLAETQFFLVTNYAAWLNSTLYPHTMDGLFAAYVAGLAFAKWGMLSNLGFSVFLFAAYEPVAKLVVIPEPETERESALAK